MKTKNKFLKYSFMLLALVLVCVCTSGVYAATNVSVSHSGSGKYQATGAGSNTNSSGYAFTVDGQRAWCIQAGVPIGGGTYVLQGQYSDTPAFSYIIFREGWSDDLKQALIWQFGGGVAGQGSYVTNPDAEFEAGLAEVNQHAGDVIGGSSARIDGGGDFVYVRDGNKYVTPWMTFSGTSSVTFSGAPGGSYFENQGGANVGGQVGDGTYRIVVPALNVVTDMTITVNANAAGGGRAYGPALYYTDGPGQVLVIGQMIDVPGAPATKPMNLIAVGDLSMRKVDEHGKPIEGAKFTITGPHGFRRENVTTNKDGYFELLEVRVGEYTVVETYVPATLVLDSKPRRATVNSGRMTTVSFTNYYQRGTAELSKDDIYEGKKPKGDSKLNGAVYELHAAEDIYEGVTKVLSKDQLVATRTTDANGMTGTVKDFTGTVEGKSCNFDGLPIGKYYWKEIQPSEGFNLSNDLVPFELTYRGMQYAETEKSLVTGYEVPIKGKVRVIKMLQEDDDTHEEQGENIELILVLDSDPSQSYNVVINEDGYAEFQDEEFIARYPDKKDFTIPYGKYTLSELKYDENGDEYYFIQPEQVIIDIEKETERRILMDEAVEAHLKIVKQDGETYKTIKEAGAQFKIWDCANNCWLVQTVHVADPYETDIYETNEDGEFTTPDPLLPGDYVLYEIKSPEKYAIPSELLLPENEADYGKVGGRKFNIGKVALGMPEDEEYPDGGVDIGDVIQQVLVPDAPLKGKIEVEKTGLMVDHVTTSEAYGKELNTLVYAEKGLQGVEFTIYANEDIYTGDGTLRYSKDTQVDVITTNEDGYAITKDLYIGQYRVVETKTPVGYIPEEEQIVDVINPDKTEEAYTINKALNNKNQTFNISLTKRFETIRYGHKDTNSAPKKAAFGVFTKQAIRDSKGNILVPEGGMVGLIETDEVTQAGVDVVVETNLNLPGHVDGASDIDGLYDIKEIYTTEPYELNEDAITIQLVYDQEVETVPVVVSQSVVNEPEYVTLSLYKISTSSLKDMLRNGVELDDVLVQQEVEDIENDIVSMDLEQVKKYFEENSIETLGGAEYRLYYDEECTEPVCEFKDGVETSDEVVIVTEDNAITEATLELPYGTYYLKETKAPTLKGTNVKYEMNDKAVKVVLTRDNDTVITHVVAVDNAPAPKLLTKKDAFTGQPVPGCTFEIRDEDGNTVGERMVTDENGDAYFSADILEEGKTYTYNELEAPDLYDENGTLYELNTEPHEFTAEYEEDEDGNIKFKEDIVVDNYRPFRKLVVRKTDSETGDPLKDCIFSIIEIDPQTREPKVDENGNYFYLVKEAATDENGEYVIEKAYKGSWKFIEVQAPEGYELTEDDMEGYEFDITDDSPETIIFEITNTGDIAVIALACLAIVCIAGIVFVVIKNKKQKSAK